MVDLIGIVFLYLSAFCLGSFFVRAEEITSLEKVLFSLAIGLAGTSWIYAMLGLVGGYTSITVLGIPVFSMILCLARQVGKRISGFPTNSTRRSALTPGAKPPLDRIVFWILLPIVLTMVIRNILESLNWDYCPDAYHIMTARAYLNAGGFKYYPGLVTVCYPMMAELLYLPLFFFSADTAGPLIHCFFGILTIPVIFSMGRRFATHVPV